MFLGGDGAEVDWIIGYDPPPEKFQLKLEQILKGEDTFKSVGDAFAKNPKDAAMAFKLARKWGDRFDETKSKDYYRKVVALDPHGKSGNYTQEWSKVTASFTEYAELALATPSRREAKQDMAPIRAFLAKYPKGPLLKDAWSRMNDYYAYQAPKEEAAKFFPEYAAKFPEDQGVIESWLARIIRDKEPIDKGIELAQKLETLTRMNPNPSINQQLAEVYDLKGDKAKTEELFGKDFMEGQVQNLAYNLISYANFWIGQDTNKDSALAMAETALKLEPDNAYFKQQVAGLYIKMSQEPKALVLFGPSYVQKNMADANALYGYARFWSQQGKNLDSALVAAKKMIEINSKSYYFWSTLADVHSKMKKHPEAIKAAEKAVELAEGPVKENMKRNLEKIKTAAGRK